MSNLAFNVSKRFLRSGIHLYATVCMTVVACGGTDEIPPGGDRCGFFEGPCADGYQCVDDPNDQCDPESALDCGGICVAAPARCGFFIGECANGYRCVDDPNDQCDPADATDCNGVCEPISP
jgi:hypothetical protein